MLGGSASAAVQAGSIAGDVTQHTDQSTRIDRSKHWHYQGPRGWLVTVTLASLVIVLAVSLVRALHDDPPAVSGTDRVGVPLVAKPDPLTHPCESDWFVPASAEEIGPLLAQGEPRSWPDLEVLARGAAADRGLVMVTVQGRHDDLAVMITDIEVEVLSRNPPPTGLVLDAPCGDPDHFRYVDVDLDRPRPQAVSRPLSPNAIQQAQREGRSIEPIAFPYEVTSTDAETFLIEAVTVSCDCTWRVHLRWSTGTDSGRLTVPENGSFRVVSGTNATRCDTLTLPECR